MGAAESAVCFPLFKNIHIPYLTAGNYSDMNEITFQNTFTAIIYDCFLCASSLQGFHTEMKNDNVNFS